VNSADYLRANNWVPVRDGEHGVDLDALDIGVLDNHVAKHILSFAEDVKLLHPETAEPFAIREEDWIEGWLPHQVIESILCLAVERSSFDKATTN